MGYYPRRSYIRAMPPSRAAAATTTVAAEPAVTVDAPAALDDSAEPMTDGLISLSRFRSATSKEWNDYVWRTRNLIIAKYYSNPDVVEARTWVNQNIEDIGNRIGDYYGPASAAEVKRQMADCLNQMINILDYLRNAPSNFEIETDRQLGEALLVWRDRTDMLADLLGNLNSSWNRIDLKNALDDFRDFWWNQIRSRRTAEWNRDLSYLDRAFENAAKMSSIVVKSISDNYPSKFS